MHDHVVRTLQTRDSDILRDGLAGAGLFPKQFGVGQSFLAREGSQRVCGETIMQPISQPTEAVIALRHRSRVANEQHDARPKTPPEPVDDEGVYLLDDDALAAARADIPLLGRRDHGTAKAWNASERQVCKPLVRPMIATQVP